MGIVDWFTNDMNMEERSLTRDLLSIAIADKEFGGDEKEAILRVCTLEGISVVELMDSIRNEKVGAKHLQAIGEKKKYLLHLVRIMSIDGTYGALELQTIAVIAKKLDVSPVMLLSFVLDEVMDGHLSKEEGITILDHFVKHFIAKGLYAPC